MISTPNRDTTSGPDDFGPPADPSRVREWSVEEFAALLEAWGFEHGELALTGSHILAILYPDAARAAGPLAGRGADRLLARGLRGVGQTAAQLVNPRVVDARRTGTGSRDRPAR